MTSYLQLIAIKTSRSLPKNRPKRNRLYNPDVARKPSATKGPRPAQGSRLLKLRQAAGLTQVELGKAIGVPFSNIALWEWSNKPPRADVLPLLAQVLNVSIDDLVGANTGSLQHHQRRSGPVSELQRIFEDARKLPRNQQRKVIDVVKAMVHEFGRSA